MFGSYGNGIFHEIFTKPLTEPVRLIRREAPDQGLHHVRQAP